jgi:hypothetical protein
LDKPCRKRPLERPGRRWDDIIKMIFMDTGCEDGKWESFHHRTFLRYEDYMLVGCDAVLFGG